MRAIFTVTVGSPDVAIAESALRAVLTHVDYRVVATDYDRDGNVLLGFGGEPDCRVRTRLGGWLVGQPDPGAKLLGWAQEGTRYRGGRRRGTSSGIVA